MRPALKRLRDQVPARPLPAAGRGAPFTALSLTRTLSRLVLSPRALSAGSHRVGKNNTRPSSLKNLDGCRHEAGIVDLLLQQA